MDSIDVILICRLIYHVRCYCKYIWTFCCSMSSMPLWDRSGPNLEARDAAQDPFFFFNSSLIKQHIFESNDLS